MLLHFAFKVLPSFRLVALAQSRDFVMIISVRRRLKVINWNWKKLCRRLKIEWGTAKICSQGKVVEDIFMSWQNWTQQPDTNRLLNQQGVYQTKMSTWFNEVFQNKTPRKKPIKSTLVKLKFCFCFFWNYQILENFLNQTNTFSTWLSPIFNLIGHRISKIKLKEKANCKAVLLIFYVFLKTGWF